MILVLLEIRLQLKSIDQINIGSLNYNTHNAKLKQRSFQYSNVKIGKQT